MLTLPIPHPDPQTIERFLKNTLSPGESDVIDSHISDCPPCQEVAGRLVDVLPETLDSAVTDDTPPKIAGCKALGLLAPGGMGSCGDSKTAGSTRSLRSRS
jgi:hypothetical protein